MRERDRQTDKQTYSQTDRFVNMRVKHSKRLSKKERVTEGENQ